MMHDYITAKERLTPPRKFFTWEKAICLALAIIISAFIAASCEARPGFMLVILIYWVLRYFVWLYKNKPGRKKYV